MAKKNPSGFGVQLQASGANGGTHTACFWKAVNDDPGSDLPECLWTSLELGLTSYSLQQDGETSQEYHNASLWLETVIFGNIYGSIEVRLHFFASPSGERGENKHAV